MSVSYRRTVWGMQHLVGYYVLKFMPSKENALLLIIQQTCMRASLKHFSCVNEIKSQGKTLNKKLNIYNASPTSLA